MNLLERSDKEYISNPHNYSGMKQAKCLLCGESASRFIYPIARMVHLVEKHEYSTVTETEIIEQLAIDGFIGSTYQ